MKKLLLSKIGLKKSNITFNTKDITLDLPWIDIKEQLIKILLPYKYDLYVANLILDDLDILEVSNKKIRIIVKGKLNALSYTKDADIVLEAIPESTNLNLVLNNLKMISANIPGYSYSSHTSNIIFKTILDYICSQIKDKFCFNLNDYKKTNQLVSFKEEIIFNSVKDIIVKENGLCIVLDTKIISHYSLKIILFWSIIAVSLVTSIISTYFFVKYPYFNFDFDGTNFNPLAFIITALI